MESTLNGRRVVVTRSAGQSKDLCDLLEKEGATAIEIPMIEFIPPLDWAPVNAAIRRLNEYNLIVFTSATAARWFFSRFRGHTKMTFHGPRVAAIGEKTAQALRDEGIRVDIIPEQAEAQEELVAAIENAIPLSGKKILFPRAEDARELLPDELRKRGAQVDVIVVYRTVPSGMGKEALASLVQEKPVDWVTFASASAARFFFEMDAAKAARNWVVEGKTKIATIGRVTRSAVEEQGLRVAACPGAPTMEAMVKAMKECERG